MAGIPFSITEGVTFDNLRCALCATYFLTVDMSEEDWLAAIEYVVPMQHNIENPITHIEKDGEVANDTWIEYWIDDDDKITQDYNRQGSLIDDLGEITDEYFNATQKLAHVTVRFMGKYAEAWAKAFHHLTKRESVGKIFSDFCGATIQEYVGKILPINVDYFGTANTVVAFDITFDLSYVEVITLPAERLAYISLAAGDINT